MANRIYYNPETNRGQCMPYVKTVYELENVDDFKVLDDRYDFDYIVCFYFGRRRGVITNKLIEKDRYVFVRRHLEFLLSNESIFNDLRKVIFVISNCNDIDYKNVSDIVNNTTLKDKINVIHKNNDNYSYGAWNVSLISRINENVKYAFLCEDDYIPTISDFYKRFINYFNENVVYVCQLYHKEHAAISNGFLSYDICRKGYKEHGNPLQLVKILNGITGYREAQEDQINFLNYYKDYEKLDICDKYYSDFYNVNTIVKYGNTKGIQLIKPILE